MDENKRLISIGLMELYKKEAAKLEEELASEEEKKASEEEKKAAEKKRLIASEVNDKALMFANGMMSNAKLRNRVNCRMDPSFSAKNAAIKELNSYEHIRELTIIFGDRERAEVAKEIIEKQINSYEED